MVISGFGKTLVSRRPRGREGALQSGWGAVGSGRTTGPSLARSPPGPIPGSMSLLINMAGLHPPDPSTQGLRAGLPAAPEARARPPPRCCTAHTGLSGWRWRALCSDFRLPWATGHVLLRRRKQLAEGLLKSGCVSLPRAASALLSPLEFRLDASRPAGTTQGTQPILVPSPRPTHKGGQAL